MISGQEVTRHFVTKREIRNLYAELKLLFYRAFYGRYAIWLYAVKPEYQL